MEGFKKFLMQGNVIELAVAVVIGTAFTAVVTAVVDGLITPLVAAAFNAEDIASATVQVGAITFGIGAVIAALINFVIVAAVVYFALVLPMAKLKEANDRRKGISPEEPAETDVDILHDIRDLLKTQQTPGTAPRA